MARLLRAAGYLVKTAGGVREAVGILDTEQVDVLVSDLGLPDGSGYDIMEHIRTRPATKGIALSGYGMEEDIARSQQAGFARHLTKPVKPQDLNTAIRQLQTV
jgi:CheY-like chemotaxis protein